MGGFLLLAALVVILTVNAAAFIAGSWRLVHYRFQLDYGEGIVLWQAAHIFDLREAYHPVERYPYVICHYPPVYHVLARLAAAFTGDLLVGGRTVSWILAMAVAALSGGLAWAITPGGQSRRALAGLLAPLLFLQLSSSEWVPYMRVDIAAIFFTLLGLFVFVLAPGALGCSVASVLFTASLFTKQTMIAGPLAVVVTMMIVGSLGNALILLLIMATLGSICLAGFIWYTHGEFYRHLFVYNQNPYSVFGLGRLFLRNLSDVGVVTALAISALFIFLPLAGRRAQQIVGALRLSMSRMPDTNRRAMLCMGLYFLATLAVSASAGKAGAYINYFLEWNVAACILAAVTVARLVRPDRKLSTAATVAILVLIVFGMNHAPRTRAFWKIARGADATLNDHAQEGAYVFQKIRESSGPVLSDDMLLLQRAGKEIPWEPAIITQLGATGVFDESQAIDRVRSKAFSLVVVQYLNDSVLYSKRMREAILSSYEAVESPLKTYTILEPRR